MTHRLYQGDGSVYWSVAGLDRGALPLQSFALLQALILWGHHQEAARRIEFYFQVYVRNSSGLTPRNVVGMQRELWDRTTGKIDFKVGEIQVHSFVQIHTTPHAYGALGTQPPELGT